MRVRVRQIPPRPRIFAPPAGRQCAHELPGHSSDFRGVSCQEGGRGTYAPTTGLKEWAVVCEALTADRQQVRR